MTKNPESTDSPDVRTVLIPLLKGLIDRATEGQRWHDLLTMQSQVRDQLAVLGLELVIDEAEGFAYVRQRPPVEGEAELPRLVPRRQLSFPVSLLLVLLRRRLVEHDGVSGERLIITRAQVAEMIRAFLPDTADEVRFLKQLDRHLSQVVELGFLRALRDRDGEYEIRRILRAFVDAQWLHEFATRLEAYRAHALADQETP